MSEKIYYRTTLVIWTDYDPAQQEDVELAQEADTGRALGQERRTEIVADPGPTVRGFFEDEL